VERGDEAKGKTKKKKKKKKKNVCSRKGPSPLS